MRTLLGALSERFTKLKTRISKSLKIATVMTVGTGFTFGTISAADSDKSTNSLKEVYHVYVDGTYFGTVDEKEPIQKLIDEKEKELKNQFEGLNLVPEQDIQYLKEYVFYPKVTTHTVVERLDEELKFNAAAIKLERGDELIGYVKSLEDANKALNRVVKKYLPDGIDEDFEFLKKENNRITLNSNFDYIPEITNEEESSNKLVLPDGTVVLDVALTDHIDVSEAKVEPNQILTVEQLEKLLARGTKGKTVHKIQENEVLGQVAKNYGLSLQQLLSLNPDLDENSIIQVGQEVFVEGDKPYIDVTYTVEVTENEPIDYKVVYKNSDKLYKGQTQVQQQGVEGKKEITYRVTKTNNEVVKKEKIDEKVVKEPVERIVLQGTKVISSRGTGSFTWPTHGGTITSYVGYRWGAYHKGIDIAGVSNRTIMAADNGVVTFAGWDGGYGNKVVINHNNGFRTVYAHLSSINVSVGQTVKRGQSIGVMGSTGNSTGVHLHFEMYKNGALVNPLNYY